MNSSRPPTRPRTYNICPTCGLDHVHDFPSLSLADQSEALDRHAEEDRRRRSRPPGEGA